MFKFAFYICLSGAMLFSGKGSFAAGSEIKPLSEASLPNISQPSPSPEPSAQPSPSAQPRAYQTGALIFHGTATAFGDVEAIESILDAHQVTYREVTSDEMDALTLDELSEFGTIIWPGGYAGIMSSSMNATTRARLREAVNERGVSFVGFCAGAFIAISPAASEGEAGPSWGLSIISAPVLPYYYLEDEGTEESMVQLMMPTGSLRHLVWWGGPYLPESKDGVIARYYQTGQPAITQTWAGKGLVLLSGPHPEAPDNWRTKLGLKDEDGLDQDIAWSMFEAALNQKPMPALM